MIKVSIVDDHQMFLDGLTSILSDFANMQLVSTAINGQDFLDKLQRTEKPHVVLLDINMPVMNGIDLIEILAEEYPQIKVLVLSMLDDGHKIKQMIDLGAKGYILKNTGREELFKAISRIHGGESYFSDEVSAKVLGSMVQTRKKVIDQEVQLSKREKEILQHIVKGLTSQEIADQLFISKLTVETHRKNIHRKLGVKGTAGLVKYAIDHMLV